jgi:hypothetical protein
MLKQFYEKALPRQGVYCVTGIDPQDKEKVVNRFAETLEEVFTHIERFKSKKQNVFVALGTFEGFSRKKVDSIFFRSLFVDLDVGEEKPYKTKEEALSALALFLQTSELPPPVRIDSGTGIHAYWLLEEDVPTAEYLPYAEKFKAYCLQHIAADPAVMAEPARIMRCPETLNYKTDPPSPSGFLDEEINTYSFEAFKSFLGEVPPTQEQLMALLPKGLDDETRKLLKLDNFKFTFAELADKSVNDRGCNQIKFLLENQKIAPRDQWAAGLTIAIHCEDGPVMIHEMSNEHQEYDHDKTESTARSFGGPRTCDWFASNFGEHCEGCKHRGRIKTPLVLGREFKAGPAPDKKNAVREAENPKEVHEIPGFLVNYLSGLKLTGLPGFLQGFTLGSTGGIYYTPPPKVDRKGATISSYPVLLTPYDLYPIRRMYSRYDGECMTLRYVLPNDAMREFLLPMKSAYTLEEFKKVMASQGIFVDPDAINHLISYIVKWGQYMVGITKADQMRTQMGWTEEFDAFVIGNKEIRKDGSIGDAAASPFVKGLAKSLRPTGEFSEWQRSFNELNREGFEIHAFAAMAGFGAPLMHLTSTRAAVISLFGDSGVAKSGALYAMQSIFGHPEELSVYSSTENGLTMRFLNLKNIAYGVDEVGNKPPKDLSNFVHNTTQAKSKIRMQASINAERESEMQAASIVVLTTNVSLYSKFEIDKASPEGENARVVEFIVRKPPALSAAGGGELGRSIFNTFRFHHGHAGPLYIIELFRIGKQAQDDKIEKWRKKFVAEFGDDATYRFYQNLVAVIFAGGEIANEKGLITIDLERVFKVIVFEIIQIRDKVVKINKIDYDSLFGDFMNKNINNTLTIRDGKVIQEPRNQLVARVSVDEGITQVSKTEFSRYLNERNVSMREFEMAMREKGLLTDSRVGRLTTGWKHAPRSNTATLLWFKSVVPIDDLTDDDTESDS